MSVLRSERRAGAYYDSIVLMQLQSALRDLDGIGDAGAVMATAANLEILAGNELLPDGAAEDVSDLLIVVRAESEDLGDAALGQVDELLAKRDSGTGGTGTASYRPRSLEAAVKAAPEGHWVQVSVPGRYAADVAGEALDLGRNVFLYSDNVTVDDEAALKERAARKGLLVMGPDCGTAMIGGVGLGFANRVRRGAVGLVAASGTGLQEVASLVDQNGGGISHAVGTGGRDLGAAAGARTALQGLDLLARDPDTRVIVLISKPPEPEIARRLLAAARATGKPVVVAFLGYAPPARHRGNLHYALGLVDAAELAMALQDATAQELTDGATDTAGNERRYLRGLFAGGTLAYEALLNLRLSLQPIASNLSADGVERLADLSRSVGHTILDLGEDELTVGRLHPMMDQELRLRRLKQEAADPEVAMILLDLVLGDGAHADPASEIVAAVSDVPGDGPEILAVVVGTENDPQGLEEQKEKLRDAGITVFGDLSQALERIEHKLAISTTTAESEVPLAALESPRQVVNVGVEVFHDSLAAQEVDGIQVDWRPPAGGNEKLQAILKKMKG